LSKLCIDGDLTYMYDKDVCPSEEMETAVEVDDEEERDIEASPKQSGKKLGWSRVEDPA
jgi:hypothetical protein